MAESAGYKCDVQVGGTSTALTNEACTKVTANTVYQITDSAKRVLDPDTAVLVEVDPVPDGSWVAGANYTVDYHTGTITFDADQGATTLVRVASGSYEPLWTVTRARAVDVTIEREVADNTSLDDAQGNGGWRTFVALLVAASGSLEVIDDGLADYDTGGTERVLLTDLLVGTKVHLTIRPDGVNEALRMWTLLESGGPSVTVDGQVTSTFAFRAAGKGDAAPFSWAQ